MSVEEEEYDIQPGISSVWLVTFGILYIIVMVVSLLLYLLVIRSMALSPRRHSPTLLLVLLIFFAFLVEFALIIEEFLALFNLFVFSDLNCRLFTYSIYGNRILQALLVLTLVYYNWLASYLKTVKFEQQTVSLFPVLVVGLFCLQLAITITPALAVRANYSDQFCVFKNAEASSRSLWVFSLLFPYYLPLLLVIPPALSLLLKLKGNHLIEPRKSQVKVSLGICGGYFLFYLLYYLLLLAREVERVQANRTEWERLLGLNIWHITRPMFVLIAEGWHVLVPVICLTMEPTLRSLLPSKRQRGEGDMHMDWEGGLQQQQQQNQLQQHSISNNNNKENSRGVQQQTSIMLESQEFHNYLPESTA